MAVFAFGPYQFDENERLLFRGQEPVPLPPKAALTLAVLLRNAPRLVEKEELLREVWPDTFVEEGNLTHNISLLRKLLADDRNGKIETVPRRGYRFIGMLEPDPLAASPSPQVTEWGAVMTEHSDPARSNSVRTHKAACLWASLLLIVLTAAAIALWRAKADSSVRQPAARGGTRNAAAYQEYLNGRLYYTKHDEESLRRSVAAFERAVELDRGYAAAYAGLAEAYFVLGEHESTDVAYERTRTAAMTALQLDPNLPEAHAVLAFGEGMLRWHWVEAEKGFRRALELEPNYTQAHIWFSIVLLRQGRTSEALREAQRALAVEPFHDIMPWLFASIYYHDRQYSQALEWIEKGKTAGARIGSLGSFEALILALRGQCSEALALTTNVSTGSREQMGAQGYTLGRCGRKAEALELEQRLRVTPGVDGATTAYFLAMIEVGMRRHEDALRNLEIAYQGRSGYLTRIKMDPVFDPLRREPRYQRLLEAMSLAEPVKASQPSAK